MGWRPCDVYACTPQELEAAWVGWASVHTDYSPEASDGIATREDLDNLLDWYASKYG